MWCLKCGHPNLQYFHYGLHLHSYTYRQSRNQLYSFQCHHYFHTTNLITEWSRTSIRDSVSYGTISITSCTVIHQLFIAKLEETGVCSPCSQARSYCTTLWNTPSRKKLLCDAWNVAIQTCNISIMDYTYTVTGNQEISYTFFNATIIFTQQTEQSEVGLPSVIQSVMVLLVLLVLVQIITKLGTQRF